MCMIVSTFVANSVASYMVHFMKIVTIFHMAQDEIIMVRRYERTAEFYATEHLLLHPHVRLDRMVFKVCIIQ